MKAMETTTTKVTFSQDELDTALLGAPNQGVEGVLQLFDRHGLDRNLIMLGHTAEEIKNDQRLSGESVEVGIEQRYLTPEVISTLKVMGGIEDPTKDFTFNVGKVPVNVKVITRRYKFFENTDPHMYVVEFVRLPNPFDTYWHARGIVQ